jgi:hypothetical protein
MPLLAFELYTEIWTRLILYLTINTLAIPLFLEPLSITNYLNTLYRYTISSQRKLVIASKVALDNALTLSYLNKSSLIFTRYFFLLLVKR